MTERKSGPELREEQAQLRDEYKRLREYVEDREMRFAIEDAGFDPDSTEGKVIAKTYEADDVTPENIAEFAQNEYGFEPQPPDGFLNEEERRAQQRAEGEDRFAAVMSGVMPPREPSEADKLQIAEQRARETGDWSEVDKMNALKLERVRASGAHLGYRG